MCKEVSEFEKEDACKPFSSMVEIRTAFWYTQAVGGHL